MCYWRRLSKRSIDDNEFNYEYTTNSTNAESYTHNNPAPIISDSLNLFKALQVRQEPEPTKAKQQLMREIYAEDEEASLICYGHMEVFLFLGTIAFLLIIVATIAIVCCLRVRKLTKNQYKQHQDKMSTTTSCSSLSPSLISIRDVLCSPNNLQHNDNKMIKKHLNSICNHNQRQHLTYN